MNPPAADAADLVDESAAPPSPFWRRHGERLAAAAVFILTVVLTVMAHPPSPAPEFAYLFAAPAALWAYRRPAFRLFAWTVLGAQALAWTILLGWLHHVTWVGVLLLGPFIGLWVGSWFLALRRVLPRLEGRAAPVRILAILGLAALWVLIEWTRTWLLSGFPWLPLAATQWQRVSILQIAAYTGAGGVSFVLVAVNLGFAAYAHRLLFEARTGLAKRSQEFLAVMFLLLVCLAVHVQETFNHGRFSVPVARFALVQPDIPQTLKWEESAAPEILGVLERETLRAAALRPDVILWPEATTPWVIRGDASVQAWTEQLVARAGAPLVLGSMAIENHGAPDEAWFNGVFTVDPKTGLAADYYAKRKLVPFGEFVPLRPVLGWLEKVVPVGGDFGRGRSVAPLVVRTPAGRELHLGALICYEDIFPKLARDEVRAGAELLVVHTNNGWFGRNGAAEQHAAHSVLRAVELRRPVLRDGNSGWSGWIDEYGNIRAELRRPDPQAGGRETIYFRGSEAVDVRMDSRWIGRLSFYAQNGDWFVGFCAVLAAFAFLLLRTGSPASADAPAGRFADRLRKG